MFTEEEKKILSNYVSDVEGDIFVLKNLPEVIKGTLFSRYSRSSKSLKETLLRDFILNKDLELNLKETKDSYVAVKKAEEFYERVLIGFGDDSIAELAGIHVAIENISNIATKFIEDTRIGISPLEKSSRYVYFDKKINGKYNYYREPILMEYNGNLYEETMDKLFDTYSYLHEKMKSYFMEKFPDTGEKGYKQVIKAKTCDTIRGLLPASTKTNVGLFGNGRAFNYLLIKMFSSNLPEIRTIAEKLHKELSKFIGVFIKKTKHTEEFINFLNKTNNSIKSKMPKSISNNDDDLELIYYEKDGERKVATMLVFENSNLSYKDAKEYVEKLTDNEIKNLFDIYYKNRTNRRHKPPRAFENTYYTFSIKADFGAYRDLQRHRILTQNRQFLNNRLGYSVPREIVDAGYESEYKDALEAASNAYEEFSKFPENAQYIIPFAFKLRWYITLNLREAFHLCELRSVRHGHPSYRKIAQNIYKKIKEVHPLFEMKFVDMNEYDLERKEEVKKY